MPVFRYMIIIAFCLTMSLAASDELWEEDLQFEARNNINTLIKGLDGAHQFRQKYVKELAEIAKGKLRNLVIKQLKLSLTEKNIQRSEGIIEVFTLINDQSTIPTLEKELLYNLDIDIRRSVIIHLPLFCVPNEKIRYEIQELVEDGDRILPPRLIHALRTPPFNPETKQYDETIDDKIRGRVERALTEQLDPIEAIINNGLEGTDQIKARTILKLLLEVNLGYKRNNWLEFWRGRGRDFKSPLQDEILTAQVNACKMLGDMGAECTPLLASRVKWLMSTPYTTAKHSALDMLEKMTSYAVKRNEVHQKAITEGVKREAERLWRQRKIKNTDLLISLVLGLAEDYISTPEVSLRLPLVDCLGATTSKKAIKYITFALRQDSQSKEMRLHAANALSKIGGEEAVIILSEMAEYRGIAVKRDLQIQEYKRIRAAYKALGYIVKRSTKYKLSATDALAAKNALQILLKGLQDDRAFDGAPKWIKPEERKIRFFARATLRIALSSVSDSYDPAYWKGLYKVKDIDEDTNE